MMFNRQELEAMSMTDRPKIVDELKAGLPGVTLGPWGWEEGRPDVTTQWDKKTWTILQVKSTSLGWHENSTMASREAGKNAAHIARCSPDNISTLIEWGERMERERDALKALATRTAEVVDIATHYEKRAEAAEAEVAELEAENARLLEALKRIEKGEVEVFDDGIGATVVVAVDPDEMQEIARAALAASDKEGE